MIYNEYILGGDLMTYFNDRLLLISDSIDNIDLFKLSENQIKRYGFDKLTQNFMEEIVAQDVFIEFNATIDKNDRVYLIHQDISLNLILTLLKDHKKQVIKLTKQPIQEVYYLDLIEYEGEVHIVYIIATSKMDKEYRIYHNYFDGKDWRINIVDDIKARELLNPIKIIHVEGQLMLAYYDNIEKEQIYMKTFDLDKKKWKAKIQLTNNRENKLYLDFILKDDQIHLTYCQYEEGNLQVRYQRLAYEDQEVKQETRQILSNPENAQNPTILYYEEKLWVSWIQHDNVMSCYSQDMGNNWSPIYLWNQSKGKDIVRYKYNKNFQDKTILNYSFGKIEPNISFIGFGPRYDTVEIPLKKDPYSTLPRI